MILWEEKAYEVEIPVLADRRLTELKWDSR